MEMRKKKLPIGIENFEDIIPEAVFCNSLRILSELLEKHHASRVILLIDEYDLPSAKAFENGYYDHSVSVTHP